MSVAHPAHFFLRCGVSGASWQAAIRPQAEGGERRCLFLASGTRIAELLRLPVEWFSNSSGRWVERRQKTKVLSKRQAPCCVACLMSGCSGCIDAATGYACVLWGTESPVSSRFLSIVRDSQQGERGLSPCGGWAQQSSGMADNVMKHIFESHMRLCWSSLIDLLCGKLKWVIYSVLSESIDIQVRGV